MWGEGGGGGRGRPPVKIAAKKRSTATTPISDNREFPLDARRRSFARRLLASSFSPANVTREREGERESVRGEPHLEAECDWKMQVRADARDKNSIELSHNKTDISSVIDHTRWDDINSGGLLFNYTSANGHFGDNKTIRGAVDRNAASLIPPARIYPRAKGYRRPCRASPRDSRSLTSTP
jgi:hypothetical protein